MNDMVAKLFGDIEIVVIESPYDTLGDPEVRDLFSRLAALKIEGYRAVYEYGVLPVDTYDFVATHYLVCRKNQGRPEILTGYKTVTLQKCLKHRLVFPGMALLRSAGATSHCLALEELLGQFAANPDKVSYSSSWTINPEVRKNPALKNLLKDLMTVMLAAHELEIGTVERLGCGVPKVKSDQYFQSLGYQRMTYRGDILPPFSQPSLVGESAVLLHGTEYTEEALRVVERYRDFWQARRIFRPSDAAIEKKAA
ncbi:MAG: hypothetical protein P4M08_02495 [Oligoflexia bacterium]|nr:hypothetical protein [Oligoflexia bacterium]